MNAIASNPELGSSVASVSDDRTCRVWPIPNSDDPTISFALSSPGMAVCWHPLEPSKVCLFSYLLIPLLPTNELLVMILWYYDVHFTLLWW